jgi:hypothetical protein
LKVSRRFSRLREKPGRRGRADRQTRIPGYSYRSEPADADLLIVNTCGFIRDAKEESIRETVELRGRFPKNPSSSPAA